MTTSIRELQKIHVGWNFCKIILSPSKEISKLSSLQKLELILKENVKENEKDIAIDLLKQDLANK